MPSLRKLTLALAICAVAPAAFAQDSTADYGAGKHFSVVASGALLEPTRNLDIAGTRADVDGALAPTLGLTYMFNDQWGVEAWGAVDRFHHRVTTNAEGKVANVDTQPVALSGQYHFGDANKVIRPFVGLGYYQSNFSHEAATDNASLYGNRIGIKTVQGGIATAGIDVNFSPMWFARADARYMQGSSDLKINGVKSGNVELDPVTVSLGVGARF